MVGEVLTRLRERDRDEIVACKTLEDLHELERKLLDRSSYNALVHLIN